jgi:hypothetical protein
VATNDRFRQMHEDANDKVQSGVSLLKTAVGLSPVAVGIWYGQRHLKSNEALNNPIARATPSQALGRAQGLAARKAQQARNARAAALVQRIKRGLGDSDELRQILGKVEEHNALLQTLSVTLEDPASGLDTRAVQDLKSQIDRLLAGSSPESVEQFAEKVTRSLLEGGSHETLLKWEENLDEFRNISTQLETPNFSIPQSGTAINEIDMGSIRSRRAGGEKLAGWQRRALKLDAELGRGGGAYSMSVKSFEEGGLQFRQAQIFDRGRWVASVPLHSEHGFIRSGQSLNTLYAAPKYAMNVRNAYQYTRQQGLDAARITGKQLRQQGAMTTYADYLIGDIGRRISAGHVDWSDFRGEMGMATQHVNRSAMGAGSFGAHIRRQTEIATNAIYGHSFGALDSNEAMGFIARLASGGGMEGGAVGAKRLITGFGRDRRSIIGIERGSGFAALRNAYGGFAVDRHQLPITYREAQITGRPSMALDQTRRVGGSVVGGIGRLGDGAMANAAQGWGTHASGGLNKMMVVDFSKGGFISRSYGDTGMGVTGVSHRVAKPVEFSVLNPKTHGHAASRALKRVLEGDIDTRTGQRRAGWARFSASELAENLYMGETGSGRKYLSRDPATEALEIALDRTGISYDKDMIYFRGRQIRKMDYLKLFSASFKGNLENIGEAGINRLYAQDSRLGALASALEGAGVKGMRHQAAYVASDMFSKGTFSFTHQIAGSARMLGISHSALRARADMLAGNSGLRMLGGQGHQIYAQAAFELLMDKGASASNIGMTLAGVWHGAEGGGVGKGGIDQGALRKMLRSRMGDKQFGQAMRAMERGLVSFVDTAQVGPSAGDWGAARVGLERRFAQTAYERMTQLGMSQQEAADVVAGIYTKKIGFGKHYALAEQMMGLGRSVTGQRNVVDAFTERGATRLKYGQWGEALTSTGTGKLTDWLRTQKQGAVFEFGDAPAHIKNAVQDVFGTSSVYMPGTAAYEAASGTTVRVAGGQSKEVSAAYGQLVSGFQKRLADHATTGGDGLRESLKVWRSNALELMSSSVANLGRGKIRGSSSPRVSSYNLSTGAGMLDKQWKAARQLFTGTGGTAVFADATMMLSELHGQKAGGAGAKQLAESARMFFTGMEHQEVGKRLGSGLMRVSGRHPLISAGNVFMAQVFRDVRQTTALGGSDEFFGQLKGAQLNVFQGLDEAGQAQYRQMRGDAFMKQLFRQDINSFADIAQHGSDHGMDANRKFFRTLIDNLDQFTGGQGGGKFIVPRAIVGGQDIGLAPQAFMDMDGDTALSMMLDPKQSARVRELLIKHNQDPAKVAAELQGRVLKGQIGDAVKKGMVSYGRTLGSVDMSERVIHDMMKEMGIAQSTGAMDVRLRGLHEALGNYGTDINKTRAYRDILGSLEENVLLKAKKLDMFVPLADELGLAFENLMHAPSTDSAAHLGNILKNKIFHGQGETFTVGQLGGQDRIGSWASKNTAGRQLKVTIDEFVQASFKAAQQAAAGNTNMPGTAKGLASLFSKNPELGFVQAIVGANMEFAGLAAASDTPQAVVGKVAHGAQQLGNLFSKIDKRMAVPLAIGAGASMLAMGAVGSPGYAAEPLSGQGEYIPPEVSDAIASGSLFANRTADVRPEDLGSHPSPDRGMMDRPINVGGTYMDRPSSYQIRGELPNGMGLGNAMAHIRSMTSGGVAGSVRINDTRRPITRSYMDRLMGEY